jgi:Flp pilus assembly pilin Flp
MFRQQIEIVNEKRKIRQERLERGATAVEYALMVGLVGIGIITAATQLSDKTTRTLTRSAGVLGLGGYSMRTDLSVHTSANTWVIFPTNSTFSGWRVVANDIDVDGANLFNAPNGDHSVDLNGNGAGGSIERIVDTVPGSQYKLTYYMGANTCCGTGMNSIIVNAGNQSASEVYDSSVETTWVAKELTFTATGDTEAIRFTSTGYASHPAAGPEVSGMVVELILT